jgi:outer membrane lipoprotein carrier protein
VISRYSRVNTIKGNFEQSMCSEELGYCQTFAGAFWLARPDKFRFDMDEPFPQQMFGDSEDLWVYLPESSAARHTSAVVNPFFEILLNSSLEMFVAESLTVEDDQNRLTLLPADSMASFRRIILLLDPENHTVNHIRIDDGFGNKTEYALAAVKYNAKLPAKTFRFVPPPGTTIGE